MKPMLAGTLKSISDLRFPCLATPKLDGIRCLILDHNAFSRNMKLIRNRHVQELAKLLPDGCDGELMVPGGNFQDVSSVIMSSNGPPDFLYHIFDRYDAVLPYESRVNLLPFDVDKTKMVLPTALESMADFERCEEAALLEGYEGIMTRTYGSPYFHGRASARNQYLLKHKRVTEGEAIVLRVVERMHNTNPIVEDAFGNARRPGSKMNAIGRGDLGSLECRDVETGIEVSVGSGFSDALRAALWQSPPIGRIIRYRYQSVGVKTAPRFPRFLCFREAE